MPSLLFLPYIANRQNVQRNARTSLYELRHRIAYTETWSGDSGDVPLILFHAPFPLVRDVCRYVFAMMDGKVGDIVLSNEHSCRYSNGKCYWRVAVRIVRLDEHFISFKDFVTLLVSHMKRIAQCSVRHFRMEAFLNL